MGFIKAQCTNCGATLDIDDSREFVFCRYCGNKIFLISEEIIKERARMQYQERILKEQNIHRIEMEKIRDKREFTNWLPLIIILIVAVIIFIGSLIFTALL